MPGGRRLKKAAVLAALLLLPYAAAAASPQNDALPNNRRGSRRESGPADDQSHQPNLAGLGKDAIIPATEYAHLKDTVQHTPRNKASAVTTNPLALANQQDDAAVRAVQPAQQAPGKSAGLYTPLKARSLQDWEMEDFVLLATVDGSVHARDRKTGAALWELAVDKPMVETVYHTHNESEQSDVAATMLDDFLWIVEPSQDGDIYIYNQAALGGLQKLHLTVKQLVADMSPYESADPAVVYNGEKTTKLYTVDASTGTISKVFGTGGSLSREPRCPKPGGLDTLDDDDECVSSGSFVLGRTEYTVTIQNRDTTEPICTLKYSEWGPNTRDGDLHSQYSSTMDNRYIYALHDGSIFGLDHGEMSDRQRSFTQKLSSPVVRIFDVARPAHTEANDPQLVVLPQPVGPINQDARYQSLSSKNRIFINHTESGGWFAMSEDTYPFVTGRAKEAQCYDSDWQEWSTSSRCSLAQLQEGFVGVHALSEFELHKQIPLTISGRVKEAENDSPVEPYEEAARLPTLPPLGKSKIISGAIENFYDTLIVIALAILGYYVANRRYIHKIVKGTKFQNPLIVSDPSVASVPSSPTVAGPVNESILLDEQKTVEGKVVPNDEKSARSRSSSKVQSSPDLSRSRTNSLGPADEQKGVRFEDQTDSKEDDTKDQPQTKKKARRGLRGGVRHKKKRNNSQNEGKEDVEQTVKELMEPPKEPQIQPEATQPVVTSVVDMTDPNGSLRIGHLTINTDSILGYGGHGTMVYKGKFGGRDVAVKRMLRDFYDIASHEVGLLQESDDHPNVIRYYDKEEDSQFFYIALELCPASLQDVVERPQDFPALINSSLDKPEMLRQITAGLNYLHSLKIVHRDIKPQNILISAPKPLPGQLTTTQQPRMLISDFGLCKKLEADQSSFRATTAHAAGTSGWRAPELLVDDDPNIKPPPPTNPDTNNSEPLVIDTQTKRSATRAIDVFSLGCIFYYCLTNGQHPFDKQDKFMREANIVKGTYNIDALGCLGDYQWEARDLVESMLAHKPKDRPDAATVLRHPFFWGPADRLQFLCDVSDGFEHEKYELDTYLKANATIDPATISNESIDRLEDHAPEVIGARGDFLRALPHDFVLTLGKQRKYKGWSLLDLLRALRNKRSHYDDMPDEVKRRIGGLPEGYLTFWTRKFPGLLLTCWRVVEEVGWTEKDRFKRSY